MVRNMKVGIFMQLAQYVPLKSVDAHHICMSSRMGVLWYDVKFLLSASIFLLFSDVRSWILIFFLFPFNSSLHCRGVLWKLWSLLQTSLFSYIVVVMFAISLVWVIMHSQVLVVYTSTVTTVGIMYIINWIKSVSLSYNSEKMEWHMYKNIQWSCIWQLVKKAFVTLCMQQTANLHKGMYFQSWDGVGWNMLCLHSPGICVVWDFCVSFCFPMGQLSLKQWF